MKRIFKFFILLFLFQPVFVSGYGQHAVPDSLLLIKLNQQIDDAVVSRDILFLRNTYADDFVFSHGSGRVEGKEGWMSSVNKGQFISRIHDSVKVELHPGIAILKGKLSVNKKSAENQDLYHLRYIRVYALSGRNWQLISHSTVAEWHDH